VQSGGRPLRVELAVASDGLPGQEDLGPALRSFSSVPRPGSIRPSAPVPTTSRSGSSSETSSRSTRTSVCPSTATSLCRDSPPPGSARAARKTLAVWSRRADLKSRSSTSRIRFGAALRPWVLTLETAHEERHACLHSRRLCSSLRVVLRSRVYFMCTEYRPPSSIRRSDFSAAYARAVSPTSRLTKSSRSWLQKRALARSAERAVDDHFAQGALERRELLIIELRDEQLRDTARVGRRGLN
jgi:hypothetical protein